MTLEVKPIKKNFLEPGSNKENLANFRKLIPYFFYDKPHDSRVREAIRTRQKLDTLLKLDKNKRRFFSVEGFEAIDKSWNKFKWRASDLYSSHYHELKEEGFLDYANYSKGRLPDGQKFFKALLKKKFFEPSFIESLTSSKVNNFYMCISRNPIDFLMVSTNQSFRSCIGLESDYPFWIGLPATVLDPNRYLVFLFNGKFKKYDIKGNEFKHFRYISRSWCIAGAPSRPKDKFTTYVVKPYPDDSMPFEGLLHAAGYATNRFRESLYKFQLPTIRKQSTFIYLDNLGLCDRKTSEAYYKRNNGWLGEVGEVSYSRGFERLNEKAQLRTAGSCVSCGRWCGCDSACPVGDSIYCSTCFNEKYRTCHGCHKTLEKEKAHSISLRSYCLKCMKKRAKKCNICGKWHSNESSWERGSRNYCRICFKERYGICQMCGKIKTWKRLKGLTLDNCNYCSECMPKAKKKAKKAKKKAKKRQEQLESSTTTHTIRFHTTPDGTVVFS